MKTMNERNFAALAAIFPAFAAAVASKDEYHEKAERSGFMPLSIEFLYPTERGAMFSLMHFYKQNGDLMRDPDIEFEVIGGAIYSRTFRQDGGLPMFREFEANSPRGKETDRFFAQWLRNIKAQGFTGAPTSTPPAKAAEDMTDDELLAALEVAPAKSPAQVYRDAGRILGKPRKSAPKRIGRGTVAEDALKAEAGRKSKGARAAIAFRDQFQKAHRARNGLA